MLAAALGAPGAVLAHDINTPAGHKAEDSVVHSAASEAVLDNGTRLRSAWASLATAEAVADDPGQLGQWGPVAAWPVVGIHVALLPNGKVLAWDSVGDAATEEFPVHNFTRATIYDPVTGTHTPATVDQGFNIFCAGFAHLFDGSLFIAGGNKNPGLEGIVQTHLFNPATNGWSLGPNMAAGRWYPSVTPLTNGEMLITEGGPDTPEVRKTDGTLRTLNTASLNLPLYPWLDVAPDGRVFYSGPNQTLRKLDTAGGGSWQTFGQRDGIDRNYGSRAVYDIGKTLVAGGGSSTKTAVVINSNGATPQVAATAPMAFGRRQHNLTLLADGSVLATGGNSTGASLIDMNGGVYNAERWDPGDRSVDHPRGTGRDTPVSLDRAAAPGRPRAFVGRRHLRHLRRRWLPGEERRSLHTAVSVQEGRLRAACTASRDHERARFDQPRYVIPDHHAGRSFDQQGWTARARVANALDRDGTALRPAVLHGRRRHADGDRARKHEHGGPGHLHALHRRFRRRPVGGEHGWT